MLGNLGVPTEPSKLPLLKPSTRRPFWINLSGVITCLRIRQVFFVLARPDFEPVTLDSNPAAVSLQDKASETDNMLCAQRHSPNPIRLCSTVFQASQLHSLTPLKRCRVARRDGETLEMSGLF
ncbi:hypothetical protein DPEC_G00251470 [Dallia pectoralis]|uniref:Uncharacterized protein n=1 Tax=Dallia pectoralis TaxID=75939 RepID=A0ACC2FTE8_DALPE|nr:hypothetical protein DPEC_G00251470 [Dallia pectoralis]